MLYQAKNGRIKMKNNRMDYVVFGNGTRNLVMIPGVGDGLKTVSKMALPFSLLYHRYTKDYRVYVFSRKAKLEKGYTTRDMATDQARAMKCLGIRAADVIGISQGGMIAQFLAIDYPELVNRLILAVTLPKSGPIIKRRVQQWVKYVEKNRYEQLMTDIVWRMYSKQYFARNGWLCPLAGRILSFGSHERFRIIALAGATHNAAEELGKIRAKTLIIGAGKDRVVGVSGSRKLARLIPDSQLIIFENDEHGVYDEAKDFHDKVLNFLEQ